MLGWQGKAWDTDLNVGQLRCFPDGNTSDYIRSRARGQAYFEIFICARLSAVDMSYPRSVSSLLLVYIFCLPDYEAIVISHKSYVCIIQGVM